MEFSNGPTGKLNLDVRICRQYPDFKVHCGKIAKNPGSQWRTQARYGTRVYQPSDASLDISLLSDFGFVAMSATDQVIVAAAGHSVTDMRKMGQKNSTMTEFEFGVLAVVLQQSIRMAGEFGDGDRIAEIIAVNSVDWKAEFE